MARKQRPLQLMIALLIGTACKRPDAPDDGTDSSDTGDLITVSCSEAPPLPELGDEWELTKVPSGGDFYQIAEAELQPGKLFLASSMNGFYRSIDAGTSWTKIQMISTHMAGQMAMDIDEPDTLFIPLSGAIRRTEDAGDIWQPVEGNADLDPEANARGLLYQDGVLWMADSQGAIWRSDDDGASFDSIGDLGFASPPPHIHADAAFGLNQGWIFLARSETRMYALRHNNNLFASDDEGVTWAVLKQGAFKITTLGTFEDEIWVGGEGGVQYSRDGGESFEYYDSGDADVEGIARLAEGDLLVATRDRLHTLGDGVLLPLSSPTEATHLSHMLALDNGTLLASDENGMLRSTDEGATWTDSSEGLIVTDLGPLLAHPTCPELVWAGTHCERGLFESQTWGDDLTHLSEYMHYVMVARAGTVRPYDIWVTTDDTLKYSTDLGQTWSTMAETTLRWHLHGLAIHPTDPDVVLTGTCTGEYGDTTARVMRSTDRGESFSESSIGIPQWEGSIHTLHYVEEDPDIVLAGTYRSGDMSHTGNGTGIGIYRSTDGGESWNHVDLDVLDVPVLAQCEDYIYAATDGGVMISVDQGETWETTLESDEQFMSVACHEESVLAVAWGEVYRSDDYGFSWESWQDGVNIAAWRQGSMPQIAVSGDGALTYLTVPGVGMYRRMR
jgi:photosystem II stability/assembly factor-like uncharacterized protein